MRFPSKSPLIKGAKGVVCLEVWKRGYKHEVTGYTQEPVPEPAEGTPSETSPDAHKASTLEPS